MSRRIAFATLALLVTAGLALAKDDQALALAGQLKGQAEALHAAAQPPEDGPKPPRIRNWMLRKECKNLKGLAEQMEVLAGRERSSKLLMRTHQFNIEFTTKRIKFGILSGGARGLEGVKPALDSCITTVKALHAHLWAVPGGGGVEAPPVEPSDPPPAEDPPEGEPPADEPPADEPPAEEPPADEPPADEPPAEEPPADEPPADEPPADEPPADEPPADEPPAEDAPEPPPAEEPPPAS